MAKAKAKTGYVLHVDNLVVRGKLMTKGQSLSHLPESMVMRMVMLGQAVEGKPKPAPKPKEEPKPPTETEQKE